MPLYRIFFDKVTTFSLISTLIQSKTKEINDFKKQPVYIDLRFNSQDRLCTMVKFGNDNKYEESLLTK